LPSASGADTTALMSVKDTAEARLAGYRAEGRWRDLKIRETLSFSHNDYLNLSRHPKILDAGQKALKRFGAGCGGSRLLGGHHEVFEIAEENIQDFFQAPSALFFSSGYLANLAAITALGSLVDGVVSDERTHASHIDAISLTKKPKTIIAHQRWQDAQIHGRQLLVAESLFSMDGCVLDKSAFLSQLHSDNFGLVDEAHAAGIFGSSGQGLFQGDEINWNQMAVVVTFGKAFGVSGAAVLGAEWVRDLLINQARSFIFTTAPSPVVPAMVSAALEVLSAEPWRRESLVERSEIACAFLKSEGVSVHSLDCGSHALPTHIISLMTPGNQCAVELAAQAQREGIGVRAIRFPTVAKGLERIRISLNLQVTLAETQRSLERLVSLCREYSLPESIQESEKPLSPPGF